MVSGAIVLTACNTGATGVVKTAKPSVPWSAMLPAMAQKLEVTKE